MKLEEIKEQLKHFRDSKNVSANRIAAAIGISATALSQFLSGQYAGDNESLARRVESFLEREREKTMMRKKEIRFVKTLAARRIYDTLRMAHLEGEIAVIYGDAGYGKTTAVKNYAEIHKDTILIEADFGYTTKILFRELHKRLGFDAKGNIHDMFEDILSKLNETGRLLIVDEAEHLPYRALELLRRLYDKSGIGLALVGMPKLIFNLRGHRGEYAQLYSRVGIAYRVDPLSEEDTYKITKAYFNEDIIDSYSEFFKYSKQNARHLAKLIYRSQRLAEINNKQRINSGIIKASADMLII